MKWSWRSFSLHLGASAGLGIALAYVLSLAIDTKRGPGGPDSTLASLATGGFVAPILIAALSGWKGWSVKPMLVAGVIVASLYSGNLGVGLATFIFAGVIYYGARKLRAIAFYYLPAKGPEEQETGAEP